VSGDRLCIAYLWPSFFAAPIKNIRKKMKFFVLETFIWGAFSQLKSILEFKLHSPQNPLLLSGIIFS
jgi:hypothetical protein